MHNFLGEFFLFSQMLFYNITIYFQFVSFHRAAFSCCFLKSCFSCSPFSGAWYLCEPYAHPHSYLPKKENLRACLSIFFLFFSCFHFPETTINLFDNSFCFWNLVLFENDPYYRKHNKRCSSCRKLFPLQFLEMFCITIFEIQPNRP